MIGWWARKILFSLFEFIDDDMISNRMKYNAKYKKEKCIENRIFNGLWKIYNKTPIIRFSLQRILIETNEVMF